MRDSPNGNSYRSDSPDSQSPRDRDRAYQSKGSYLQKIREKERENRDYKMSREKYVSNECRSPKEKRSRDSKDSEHRTNHDRSSLDDKLMHSVKVSSSSSQQRDRKPTHNCQEKVIHGVEIFFLLKFLSVKKNNLMAQNVHITFLLCNIYIYYYPTLTQ